MHSCVKNNCIHNTNLLDLKCKCVNFYGNVITYKAIKSIDKWSYNLKTMKIYIMSIF